MTMSDQASGTSDCQNTTAIQDPLQLPHFIHYISICQQINLFLFFFLFFFLSRAGLFQRVASPAVMCT